MCSLECPDFFPNVEAVSGRVSDMVLSEACDFNVGGGRVGGGVVRELRVLDIDPDRLCAVTLGFGVGGSGLFGGGDVVVGGITSDGLVVYEVLECPLVVLSFVGRGDEGNAILRPSIFRLSIPEYQCKQG